MSLFHRHDWREVQRKAVKGAVETGRAFESAGAVGKAARDALYGYTLVEQCCESCGRVRVDRFTGAVPHREEAGGDIAANECVTKGGKPKLAFTTQADAELYDEEHNHGEHYAVYRCGTCGKWHRASRHGVPDGGAR